MSSQVVSDCVTFEGNNMRVELIAERGLEGKNPTLPGSLHSPFFFMFVGSLIIQESPGCRPNLPVGLDVIASILADN